MPAQKAGDPGFVLAGQVLAVFGEGGQPDGVVGRAVKQGPVGVSLRRIMRAHIQQPGLAAFLDGFIGQVT
ncbi:hypothetical protein D3C87_1787610 [compost metagenome]